jgi:hypothetical protein
VDLYIHSPMSSWHSAKLNKHRESFTLLLLFRDKTRYPEFHVLWISCCTRRTGIIRTATGHNYLLTSCPPQLIQYSATLADNTGLLTTNELPNSKIFYQVTCVDSAAESGGSSRDPGDGPTVTVVTVACCVGCTAT